VLTTATPPSAATLVALRRRRDARGQPEHDGEGHDGAAEEHHARTRAGELVEDALAVQRQLGEGEQRDEQRGPAPPGGDGQRHREGDRQADERRRHEDDGPGEDDGEQRPGHGERAQGGERGEG
jgi:hypothetical protein